MVTGPLLVVALSVASIASAAPIFDLGGLFDWESEESEENIKQKQETKNVVIVHVGGNWVSDFPNMLTTPDSSGRATTIPNMVATGNLPSPNGGAVPNPAVAGN